MNKRICRINSIAINDHTEYSDNIIITEYTLTKNFRLHRHSYYELEYVTDGMGIERFNGIDTELTAGSVRLISPSDVHELLVDGHLTIIKLCFDTASISPNVFNRAKGFLCGSAFKVSGKAKESFDALFSAVLLMKEAFNNKKCLDTVSKSLLESIILTASEYLVQNTDSGKLSKKGDVSAVLQHLHSRFAERLTLSDVAREFHFTPSYLSRRFHDEVGESFVRYLKKLRLEYAAALLRSTDAEITEICYESGFSSPSSFANDFKRHFGISATEYREKTKNEMAKS